MGEVQRPASTRRAVSVGRRRYPGPRRVGRRGNDVLTDGDSVREIDVTEPKHRSVATGRRAAAPVRFTGVAGSIRCSGERNETIYSNRQLFEHPGNSQGWGLHENLRLSLVERRLNPLNNLLRCLGTSLIRWDEEGDITMISGGKNCRPEATARRLTGQAPPWMNYCEGMLSTGRACLRVTQVGKCRVRASIRSRQRLGQ